MVYRLNQMVKETSTTTGTGTYTLEGPVTGFLSFEQGIGIGNSCTYFSGDSNDWYLGFGTVADADHLTRDGVIINKAGGTSVLDWGAGTRTIFVTTPALYAAILNQINIWAAEQKFLGNKLSLDDVSRSWIHGSASDQVDIAVANKVLLRLTEGVARLVWADDGATAGPLLDLVRTSASAVAGDILAQTDLRGSDDAPAEVSYARLKATVIDPTAGAHKGSIDLEWYNGAAYKTLQLLNNAVSVGDGVSLLTAGKTATNSSALGAELRADGAVVAVRSGLAPFFCNRLDSDGTLVDLRREGLQKGTISVSGETVSYNAFHGAHWSQWSTAYKPKEEPPLGTVLCTTGEPCFWREEQPEGSGNWVKVKDDRHTKVRPSLRAKERAVYGTYHGLDEEGDIMVSAVGLSPHVLCIGPVAIGDLLETSDVPGQAQAQKDDLRRASTIGKAVQSVAPGEIKAIPAVLS